MRSNCIDETGRTHGMLKVLRRYKTSPAHGAYWLCVCECGQECVVSGAALRNGATRSCGCLRQTHGRRISFVHSLKHQKGRKEGEPLKSKTVYLCAACRQKLKSNLDIRELKGDETPEKDSCAFCRRKCYGAWYEISYKGAAE